MTQSTDGRTEGGYAWAGSTARTQPHPPQAAAPTAPQSPTTHGPYGSPTSPYAQAAQPAAPSGSQAAPQTAPPGAPHMATPTATQPTHPTQPMNSGPAGTVLPPTDAPGTPHPGGQPAGPGSFFPPPPPAKPRQPRNGPGWFGVGAVGIGAAVLASLLTAGVVTAVQDDTTSAGTATPTTSSASVAPGPVTSSSEENPDWQAVATAVQPSVVAVQVSAQGGSGEGSGVILGTDGRILTNNHVVAAGASGGSIRVVLSDGRGYAATVVGTDPSTDLAVIKLQNPPSDLKPATLGSSDSLIVGQNVMAVGNPLGLAGTVTTGIVSAVNRPVTTQGESTNTLQSETVTTNAIQTDAAINPGNSGGALVDAQGRVIGINSSIASLGSGAGGQSGSIGLGFAIPIDEAKYVAEQLTNGGTVDHAWLGVGPDDGEVTVDGASREAAQLKEIIDGSPAEAAGLKAGDYVIAVDGDTVNSAESLVAQLHERQPDQAVTLTVVRDGRTQDIKATLGTRPAAEN